MLNLRKEFKGKNGLMILVLLLVFFLSLATTFAYFTATANRNSSNLAFSDLTLTYVNNEGVVLEQGGINTGALDNLIPGQVINFSNIDITNSGNIDCYCLVKLNLVFNKDDLVLKVFDGWYNLSGDKINTSNILKNNVAANEISAGESVDLSLSYEIDYAEFDNKYIGATVEYNLIAYGVQKPYISNKAFTNNATYASYFIYTTYNDGYLKYKPTGYNYGAVYTDTDIKTPRIPLSWADVKKIEFTAKQNNVNQNILLCTFNGCWIGVSQGSTDWSFNGGLAGSADMTYADFADGTVNTVTFNVETTVESDYITFTWDSVWSKARVVYNVAFYGENGDLLANIGVNAGGKFYNIDTGVELDNYNSATTSGAVVTSKFNVENY